MTESEGGDALAAPSTQDLQARAIHASWWTAVQAVAGVPLAFVANLVVARTLGPHGYGLVASYMAGFALVLAVLNAGISDATIQWGAAAYARGDRSEMVGITRRCSGYHLFVEGPLGALAAIWILRHEPVWTQIVAAVAVGITMAFGTAVVMVTTTSRTSVLAKQALLLGVALQVSVILAALQTHDAGWVWVVRLAVGAVTVLWPLLSLPRDLRNAVFRPMMPRGWPAGFIQYSVRTLIGGLVAAIVFSRSEVLVLDAYGLIGQAGLYALAVGLATQITAPIDAMLGPLVPAAASLVATRRDRAAEAIQRGIRLSGVATVPLLALVVPVLALLVPLIYGSRYRDIGLMFAALGLISCIQSALHPVTAFVGAVRRPLTVLGLNTVALVVDLGIIISLGPAIGAPAAAIANASGQVVSLALSIWLVRRELGVSAVAVVGSLRPMMLVGLAALISTAVAASLGLPVIAAAALAAAVSCTSSWIVLRSSGGVVRENDLAAVSDALPGRLRPFVKIVDRLGLVD